jgi:DNA-binding response OmpR family regulator
LSVKDSDLLEQEIEQEIIEKKKLLGDKPAILIVEDSEDVRRYLNGLLKNDYRIFEAINGEDGIKKTVELIPDLIISDVMMPSMDGYEFCKKIKTNWQTSHIPVILLTAKASTESRIEGLETGADAYLTKPFNSKELSVRIKNLLEQRKKLRERFSKEIKIETSSIAVTSLDNEFLQKAFDIAEKNLSNTEFNSESFAKEMFVSRSQLHRKLLAITSQAPGEFIRTFRLKRAATFILEKRLNITQIAFEVGFGSPSHFTKAFRQQFNCLPTEFIEKNNS